MAKSRKPIRPRQSKRLFKKTAVATESRNVAPPPMRGGYRM